MLEVMTPRLFLPARHSPQPITHLRSSASTPLLTPVQGRKIQDGAATVANQSPVEKIIENKKKGVDSVVATLGNLSIEPGIAEKISKNKQKMEARRQIESDWTFARWCHSQRVKRTKHNAPHHPRRDVPYYGGLRTDHALALVRSEEVRVPHVYGDDISMLRYEQAVDPTTLATRLLQHTYHKAREAFEVRRIYKDGWSPLIDVSATDRVNGILREINSPCHSGRVLTRHSLVPCPWVHWSVHIIDYVRCAVVAQQPTHQFSGLLRITLYRAGTFSGSVPLEEYVYPMPRLRPGETCERWRGQMYEAWVRDLCRECIESNPGYDEVRHRGAIIPAFVRGQHDLVASEVVFIASAMSIARSSPGHGAQLMLMAVAHYDPGWRKLREHLAGVGVTDLLAVADGFVSDDGSDFGMAVDQPHDAMHGARYTIGEARGGEEITFTQPRSDQAKAVLEFGMFLVSHLLVGGVSATMGAYAVQLMPALRTSPLAFATALQPIMAAVRDGLESMWRGDSFFTRDKLSQAIADVHQLALETDPVRRKADGERSQLRSVDYNMAVAARLHTYIAGALPNLPPARMREARAALTMLADVQGRLIVLHTSINASSPPLTICFNGCGNVGKSTLTTELVMLFSARDKSPNNEIYTVNPADKFESKMSANVGFMVINELQILGSNHTNALQVVEKIWAYADGGRMAALAPDVESKGSVFPQLKVLLSSGNSPHETMWTLANPYAGIRRVGGDGLGLVTLRPGPWVGPDGGLKYDELARMLEPYPRASLKRLEVLDAVYSVKWSMARPLPNTDGMYTTVDGCPKHGYAVDAPLSVVYPIWEARVALLAKQRQRAVADFYEEGCELCGRKKSFCVCAPSAHPRAETYELGPKEDAERAAVMAARMGSHLLGVVGVSVPEGLRTLWAFLVVVGALPTSAVGAALVVCVTGLGYAVGSFLGTGWLIARAFSGSYSDLARFGARLHLLHRLEAWAPASYKGWVSTVRERKIALAIAPVAVASLVAAFGLLWAVVARVSAAPTKRERKLQRREEKREAGEPPGPARLGKGGMPLAPREDLTPVVVPEAPIKPMGPAASKPSQTTSVGYDDMRFTANVPGFSAYDDAVVFAQQLGKAQAGVSIQSMRRALSMMTYVLDGGGLEPFVALNVGGALVINAHTWRKLAEGPMEYRTIAPVGELYGRAGTVRLAKETARVNVGRDMAVWDMGALGPIPSSLAGVMAPLDLSGVVFVHGEGVVARPDRRTGRLSLVPVRYAFVKGPPMPAMNDLGREIPHHWEVVASGEEPLAVEQGHCMMMLFHAHPPRLLGTQMGLRANGRSLFIPLEQRVDVDPEVELPIKLQGPLSKRCACVYARDIMLYPVATQPGHGRTTETAMQATPWAEAIKAKCEALGWECPQYAPPDFGVQHTPLGDVYPIEASFVKHTPRVVCSLMPGMVQALEPIYRRIEKEGARQRRPLEADQVLQPEFTVPTDLGRSAGFHAGCKRDWTAADSRGVRHWLPSVITEVEDYIAAIDAGTMRTTLAKEIPKDEGLPAKGGVPKMNRTVLNPDLVPYIAHKMYLDPLMAHIRECCPEIRVGTDSSRDWDAGFGPGIRCGDPRLKAYSSDASGSDRVMAWVVHKHNVEEYVAAARAVGYTPVEVERVRRMCWAALFVVILTVKGDWLYAPWILCSGWIATTMWNSGQGQAFCAVARSMFLFDPAVVDNKFEQDALYGDDVRNDTMASNASEAMARANWLIGMKMTCVYTGSRTSFAGVHPKHGDFLCRYAQLNDEGVYVGALTTPSFLKSLLIERRSKTVPQPMVRRSSLLSAHLALFHRGREQWDVWAPVLEECWWHDVPRGVGPGPPTWDAFVASRPSQRAFGGWAMVRYGGPKAEEDNGDV